MTNQRRAAVGQCDAGGQGGRNKSKIEDSVQNKIEAHVPCILSIAFWVLSPNQPDLGHVLSLCLIMGTNEGSRYSNDDWWVSFEFTFWIFPTRPPFAAFIFYFVCSSFLVRPVLSKCIPYLSLSLFLAFFFHVRVSYLILTMSEYLTLLDSLLLEDVPVQKCLLGYCMQYGSISKFTYTPKETCAWYKGKK